MLKLNQAGDTIVEVLIVLAILGLALGMSYATANRSLLGARQAQEHTEALALLQGQIEQLRDVSGVDTTVFNPSQHTSGFCVISKSVVDLAATPNGCTSGLYDLKVKRVNDSYGTFTFTAAWDDVKSSTRDNVNLTYRLYQ